MKNLAVSITLVSLLCISIFAQDVDKKMLTIQQPVDIVTATATAIRAAKHMGRDVDSHIITGATYFGDDALPHGPSFSQREKTLRELAKEKGIPLPCWMINFSQRKITANRIDDYTESLGITVFVSSPKQAAVLDYRFEDQQ